MPLTVTPLSAALGAEITGVDVAAPDDSALAAIDRAFLDHQVLAIRDQSLTPGRHIAFGGHFGALAIHENAEFALAGNAEILILSNDRKDGRPLGVPDAGDAWHSDFSYREVPSRATILFALQIPDSGGDTEFADMYAAYETLPAATKARIDGLKAVHTINKLRNSRVVISAERRNAAAYYSARGADTPDVTHKLVRTHPETGRKALYLSPRFTIGIEGMDDDAAQELLDELFAHQIRPEFIYRHQWRAGDVVMWDNRCVIHRACGGHVYPDIRTVHRITVLGEAPV